MTIVPWAAIGLLIGAVVQWAVFTFLPREMTRSAALGVIAGFGSALLLQLVLLR